MIISPGGFTTYDDIGAWLNLGTIAPEYNVWEKFPVQANFFNSVFRLTYDCSDYAKIRSFGYLRSVYSSDVEIHDRANRFYPKPGLEIIYFKYPDDFKVRSSYFPRRFEVMRIFKGRLNLGYSADISWTVKLEELEG